MARWLNNATLDLMPALLLILLKLFSDQWATFFLTICNYTTEEMPHQSDAFTSVVELAGLSHALMILYDVFSVMNKSFVIVH